MSLKAIEKEVSQCTLCELHKSRTQTVFSDGNTKADIFLIGEGPGANEDLQGIPFVGRSGKLLDKLLNEAGLSRKKNIYISNMVKCRPHDNRDPKKIEIVTCIHYLEQQIELVNPKIILCIGRVAAQYLIRKNLMVTKEHGIFFSYQNRPAMATLHPASLLRNPRQTPLVQDDFRLLNEKLNQL